MDPASTLRQISLACSSGSSKPSPSRHLASFSCGSRSAPPASSAKSPSAVRLRFCASARRASEALVAPLSEMVLQAARAAWRVALFFFIRLSALVLSLASSFLASIRGPLVALIFLVSSVKDAFTFERAEAASRTDFSTPSKTVHGVANFCRSSPFAANSSAAESVIFVHWASTGSSSAVAVLRMAAASRRSLASRWAVFSAASTLANSFLALFTLPLSF
mmetsp:Transcript_130926/g.310499  ORF Transcript_130926/g.310499 Transcript_130926/m.310499 type:complete len:220 (+) Transcript_130926:1246-1905(+)